jgi:hypothetical protein
LKRSASTNCATACTKFVKIKFEKKKMNQSVRDSNVKFSGLELYKVVSIFSVEPTLQMTAVRFSESRIKFYQTAQSHIPEERIFRG